MRVHSRTALIACLLWNMSSAVLERIEERALGLTGAPYIEELQLVRYMDNQTYEV